MRWRWTTVPKFKQSYFKPTFEYDKSLFEGLVWPVTNSKGTGTYDITLANEICKKGLFVVEIDEEDEYD